MNSRPRSLPRSRSIRALWLTLSLMTLVWTLMLAGVFGWELRGEDERFTETLRLKAEMLFQSTQALRSWVGSHGGIYVQVGDGVVPNPLLAGMDEQNLETPSGRHLTLFNSPALLRQVMDEFEAQSGNRIRFTSLQPVNPANLADPWERVAINKLASGDTQVAALTEIDGRPFYRLLGPMVLQQQCLSCHDYAADQVGTVIGAVSVSLDVGPDYTIHQQVDRAMTASHIGVWGMGLLGLVISGWCWWRLLSRLEQSASHDSLTGFYNRKDLLNRLESEVAVAKRYGDGLALIMFDIDYFKRVNDCHGHQVGDEVLKALSGIIQGQVRAGDWVVRYGGEEFLLVCPHTGIEGAVEMAERVRCSVMAAPLQTRAGEVHTTISAGVAAYSHQVTVESLVKAADDALYQAKHSGRNCVCSFDPIAEQSE